MRSRLHNLPVLARYSTALAICVLLVLFAGTAAEASVHGDAASADGDLLTDISISHEIDFGKSVHVTLDASVNFPVTELRAVYAPVGDRRVSSYTYPAFTQTIATETLQADFTIRTGGSAYVPPGTIFELFFELTSNDGSVTATESRQILYLDPTKNWSMLSVPDAPVDFYYYGFSSDTAGHLSSRVNSSWRDIAAAIGVDSSSVDRFRAVIYPDVREMNEVFPPTSDAASDGIFFGGFAMQRFGVFVLGGPWPDSVMHELTHLLVDTRVSSPLSPGVPSWLHEGLAQYFEAGTSSGYTSQLGRAAVDGRLLPLRNRNTVPARSTEIGLFYTQVGSFVGELIEDRGPELMAETLRLIDSGDTAADAIEKAYGEPLWELENEWRLRLGADALPPPPEPTETPGEAATPASQSTATAGAEIASPESEASTGTTTSEVPEVPSQPAGAESGFNWTGPLIGGIAAAAVFMIWSFRVNRRRVRSLLR